MLILLTAALRNRKILQVAYGLFGGPNENRLNMSKPRKENSMQSRENKKMMAFSVVFLLLAILAGCATSKQIQSLEERVNQLQGIAEKAQQSAEEAKAKAQDC